MLLRDLLQDIPVIEMHADPAMEISGVSYDSRSTCPGDLFIAIVGTVSDGHRFIPAAVEKGAAAVLCQRPPEGEIPYVLVEDSRYALAIAGRNFFGDPAGEMTMIGVTGTNGKTTTTYLIKHILETALGAKVGLIGTNCNMIGPEELPTERTTPESFELQKLFREMRDAGCTHIVMEVSSHSLVLERVAGIRFAVGIFTNLTQDHLDFHKDMDDYAAAKAKLFAVSDYAVLNSDDVYAPVMAAQARCPVFRFAIRDAAADLRAEHLELKPDGVAFDAVCGAQRQSIRLGIPGRFSVYNALGVISACLALGVSLGGCAQALSTARGVKGRVETVPTDGDYTILIDYSHTPDALENVLKTVRETCTGRVVAVFGCGGDRDRKKRPIMGRIGTELADFAIITSDNPRTEDPEAIIAEILTGVTAGKERYVAIPDRVSAIDYAITNHRPGDVIVLAGKGHETYQEINHVKHHMDEREIVADILERRKEK
ncbi:MAG: UDP-N-acetylmuramoyl-L-alanyl-D-glutamate--2,6-diaminopimelate ligase [Ruminococcaceae bacterium]|nr:UDP-N-acetylmuramoyl-L-alanyl-D-glutamate--2,6-diaminopimelate ligase [Oscillospiraceae bacterium]